MGGTSPAGGPDPPDPQAEGTEGGRGSSGPQEGGPDPKGGPCRSSPVGTQGGHPGRGQKTT